MARSLCRQCHYPTKVCICHAVEPVSHRNHIYVLQHPSEVKIAKNTVRLAQLSLEKIQCYIGEKAEDFESVRTTLQNSGLPTYLVYPDQDASPIEQQSLKIDTPINLIFLDGTWKKTHKLYQLNSWLKQFPTLTFSQLPANQYRIRKAQRSDSLSTLEAISHSLHILEKIDTAPLYNLLNAMIERQLSSMPSQVRDRY